jgi:tRNA(adenine34) deaminase
MLWEELAHPWQACLEEAWAAYCAGSVPIGAVVADPAGTVLARGRNRLLESTAPAPYLCNIPLAHAEVNALAAFDYRRHDPPYPYILYTTTEPCPMCLGTFYMSGLRELRYASRDPYAGSANMLGTTPYLRRKTITVAGPQRSDLETVIAALHVEHSLGLGRGRGGSVTDEWTAVLPQGVALGQSLAATQRLRRLRSEHAAAGHVVDMLARCLRAV